MIPGWCLEPEITLKRFLALEEPGLLVQGPRGGWHRCADAERTHGGVRKEEPGQRWAEFPAEVLQRASLSASRPGPQTPLSLLAPVLCVLCCFPSS